MRTPADVERIISNMLRKSLPERLRGEIDIKDAKRWVRDHLKAYAEEQQQFPEQSLLPWTNMIAYDDWEQDAFFVILILREDALRFFCGTGSWPEVRDFGEGEAESIPAARLHRAWASRFNVPCRTISLTRDEVKAWLRRKW